MAPGPWAWTLRRRWPRPTLVGSSGQCVETLLAWRERWGLTYIGLNEDSWSSSVRSLRPWPASETSCQGPGYQRSSV
ncbi:MAG: hypothetical protein Ct9H300mP12_01210 [Acidimicrobiales bacterium]|nr:MAG: hypothetical protein Ct9H300mP12_01210 [Acidimicrobiales bacterium]